MSGFRNELLLIGVLMAFLAANPSGLIFNGRK